MKVVLVLVFLCIKLSLSNPVCSYPSCDTGCAITPSSCTFEGGECGSFSDSESCTSQYLGSVYTAGVMECSEDSSSSISCTSYESGEGKNKCESTEYDTASCKYLPASSGTCKNGTSSCSQVETNEEDCLSVDDWCEYTESYGECKGKEEGISNECGSILDIENCTAATEYAWFPPVLSICEASESGSGDDECPGSAETASECFVPTGNTWILAGCNGGEHCNSGSGSVDACEDLSYEWIGSSCTPKDSATCDGEIFETCTSDSAYVFVYSETPCCIWEDVSESGPCNFDTAVACAEHEGNGCSWVEIQDVNVCLDPDHLIVDLEINSEEECIAAGSECEYKPAMCLDSEGVRQNLEESSCVCNFVSDNYCSDLTSTTADTCEKNLEACSFTPGSAGYCSVGDSLTEGECLAAGSLCLWETYPSTCTLKTNAPEDTECPSEFDEDTCESSQPVCRWDKDTPSEKICAYSNHSIPTNGDCTPEGTDWTEEDCTSLTYSLFCIYNGEETCLFRDSTPAADYIPGAGKAACEEISDTTARCEYFPATCTLYEDCTAPTSTECEVYDDCEWDASTSPPSCVVIEPKDLCIYSTKEACEEDTNCQWNTTSNPPSCEVKEEEEICTASTKAACEDDENCQWNSTSNPPSCEVKEEEGGTCTANTETVCKADDNCQWNADSNPPACEERDDDDDDDDGEGEGSTLNVFVSTRVFIICLLFTLLLF